ncbi:retron St85 family RNA-directed DNA polymerase [Methylosinus sp. Ce-a6]|uniref:retron St85 family RNA-directed DNA polymerase n=1 Tax=Methylosinus sp. Ce-a6 TaxID=2172005 RepID=UPI00135AA4CC|nr:retron St85 family RNA-directed DNA polymerase [Methylosinus sp. Ce-a6]
MSDVVQALVAASGLSERDVRTIIATAPSRYKTYSIPKRRGGERIISQPAREVKFLQRILVEEILSRLPVHDAAMAYREGRSIRDNAAVHAGGGAILKFDFADFFPSIKADDWAAYCRRHSVFKDIDDICLSANLLFRRTKYGSVMRLAIGAPSSPHLSNILMREFDQRVTEAVAKEKVKYTRYADDLTFSAKRAHNLIGIERMLRRIVREVASPHLRLNEDKTVLATRKYRRVVTGLVLADNGKVSLGRDRKRDIRAALHHYALGQLNGHETAHLSGLLAFVNAIEPEFLERLVDKYGSAVIERIKARFPPTANCQQPHDPII